MLEALDDAVDAVLGDTIGAIGLGVPSNLERGTGRVLRATNLPFDDFDLARHVRERFGLPVGLENDANAAALAESKLGAGRGSPVSPAHARHGVGGGLVLDDRLYRGWAEFGHMVLVERPSVSGSCHGRGHVETYVSGTAADRAAQELWGEEADAYVLVERARAGDEEGDMCLTEIGALLGSAIGSLVNSTPSLVLIGGGFVESAAAEPPNRAGLDVVAGRRSRLRTRHPRAARLSLGEAGLVGAALVDPEALDGAR